MNLDLDIVKHHHNFVDLGAGRDINVPTGFLQRDVRSHVLLAACGAEERAWETHGHGAFTTAFIQTLIMAGVDKVTYTGFMRRLPSLPK